MVPDNYSADYLFYVDKSPVQFGSKTKLFRYLKDTLGKDKTKKKLYLKGIKDVLNFSKQNELGTHFQHHPRKNIGEFHFSLYPNKDQYFHKGLFKF